VDKIYQYMLQRLAQMAAQSNSALNGGGGGTHHQAIGGKTSENAAKLNNLSTGLNSGHSTPSTGTLGGGASGAATVHISLSPDLEGRIVGEALAGVAVVIEKVTRER
jgi:hypothetical protein